MTNHKAFLLAAIVLMSSSIAGADLILTLNGNDLSDSPLISSMGQFLVAVEGSTQIEPNDVSLGAVGGVLEPVPDANNEYYFEFDANSNEATISLVTAIDMVIDGNSIPAGAKIYELWLFCNRAANIFAAAGMGLDELIWSEGQSASSPDSSTLVASEDTSGLEASRPDSGTTPAPWIEALVSGRPRQQEQRVLLDCPVDTSESKREESCSESVSLEHADTPEPPSAGSSGGGLMTMGTQSVIEVSCDITSNQIWTSDNTYQIIADVNVQALLVIEPGTMVAFGPEKGLFVNNGGALVSSGTPDNPIIYTSDSQDPWYGDYYCAVFIEETASVATKITYSYIEYAYAGIVISNRRLDAPIENNYFFNNGYGIVEQGIDHTDILNNLIVASYYSGIEVFLESATGQADANSHVLIQNNTCDYYQDCGITVHGVPNIDDAALVILANNIVSESYQYGLNLVDGYMYATVLNTGYYDNAYNKNWEFQETNPVIETHWPYQNGTGWLPVCYLDPNSSFIDAGAGFIDETGVLGLTTDANGPPDSNMTDIGFHYCRWEYVNAGQGEFLAGDLNQDRRTDFKDFAVLGNAWQTTYDFNDLAGLADTWLKRGGPLPDIVPTLAQDPNNVSGDLEITITVPEPNIYRVFAVLDGQNCGQFGGLAENRSFVLETTRHLNGAHSLKAVYLYDDMVVSSQPVQVVFDNDMSVLTGSDAFSPGEDYDLYGIGSGTYRVEVEDIINETIVYSETFTTNIQAHIDGNTFSEEYGIYEVDIDRETLLLSTTWQDIVEEIIGRKFKKEDFLPNVGIKMVVSIGSKDLEKSKQKCWRACVKAAVGKAIWPVFLNAKACTWENLRYCLLLNNVKMWYHVAHGNHELWGEPARQCIETADGLVFSFLKKDYNPNYIPPGYKELSSRYEKKCHSIPELGLIGSPKMIWVQFNACYSTRTDEFPEMLGIVPMKDPPMGNQLFVGWKEGVLAYDILGNYNQFEEDYWDLLRQGFPLIDAVNDSLPPGGGSKILDNFVYHGVLDWQFARFRYPEIN